eukprot:TRINITY_DN25345_c0_g1_i1.p1 TRINITY_DN25345_c0_g1~~TRINITY_DN25345_c0_g1_i1.p1  ORF type:complete len:398 (+),score=116.34 TRINITY_DN25345_c0_g1_i1:54-1247(+)
MSVVSTFSTAIFTEAATSVMTPEGREDKLFDMLHARRFAIRKEFMQDGVPLGTKVDGKAAAKRVAHVLRLRSRQDRQLLLRLIQSQCDEAGCIDPETIGATRVKKGDAEHEQLEETRFRGGVLQPFQQTVLAAKKSEIGLGIKREHYAAGGRRHAHPPYAVLGDSERMSAVESAAINYKIDVIRGEFDRAFAGLLPGGSAAVDLVPRNVFFTGLRAAMQRWKYNSTLSWHQCLQIAAALDPDQTGFISLNNFIKHYAWELMKRPSMRATLGSGDILSWGGWGDDDSVPPPPTHPYVPVPPSARGLHAVPTAPDRPHHGRPNPRGAKGMRLPYASAFKLAGSHPRNPKPQVLVPGTTRSCVLRSAETQHFLNQASKCSSGRWKVKAPPPLFTAAPEAS